MKYLGVKLVDAEVQNKIVDGVVSGIQGYKVTYEDGYVSWSPKEAFEKHYMPLADPEGTKITETDVCSFVKDKEASMWGDKTTVLHTTLKNGFIISESSSCVDPANFDMAMGAEICVKKTKDKIWGYLGFLLQCAKDGMK